MSLNPALQIIKHFEGLRLTPYVCSGGKLTIGWGHVIRPFENFSKITQEDAERLLITDIRFADQAVKKLVKAKINNNQHCALVSFVFNLGEANFANSTLLKVINQDKPLDAPAEMIRWVYAGGVKLKGLARRRASEIVLYLS